MIHHLLLLGILPTMATHARFGKHNQIAYSRTISVTLNGVGTYSVLATIQSMEAWMRMGLNAHPRFHYHS